MTTATTIAQSLLRGLPDLGELRPDSTGVPLFQAAARADVPASLRLRRRDDGSPWFRLTIGRRLAGTPATALLELGLTLCGRNGVTLERPVAWRSGRLVLTVTGPNGRPHTAVSEFVPSGPTSLSAALELDIDTALLLRDGLSNPGNLRIEGHADLLVPGVAARAARETTIDLTDAANLLRGAASADAPDGVDLEELIGTLIRDGEVTGGDAQVAEALADRLVARLTEPTGPGGSATEADAVITEGDAGRVIWDLRVPSPATRWHRVPLTTITPGEAPLADAPLDVLMRMETIPPLASGVHGLAFRDNLPAVLHGIRRLAVEVVAPPVAPSRLAASTALLELRPAAPGAAAQAGLRLAPTEPLRFEWRTVVITSEPVARVLRGPTRTSTRAGVVVTPADLPVSVHTITADRELTAEGDLVVTVRDLDGGRVIAEAALSDADQAAHFAVPATDQLGNPYALDARLIAKDGASIEMGRLELTSRAIGTDAIPGLGPNTVEVTGEFGPDDSPVVIALRPDDPASPTPEGLVVLGPGTPSARWTYLATSPFRTGFRHRRYRRPDQPQLDWSEPTSASASLRIDRAGVTA